MKKQNYKIVNNQYLECEPGIQLVNNEKDLLLVLEKLLPQARSLLIYQDNLNPDFFDLSTLLAGEILQKIATYSVRTAFIVDLSTIRSERFKDLVREANTKDEYRFFRSKPEALEWLLKS